MILPRQIWDLEERVCLNTLVDAFPHPPFWIRQPMTAFEWYDGSQSIIASFSSKVRCGAVSCV